MCGKDAIVLAQSDILSVIKMMDNTRKVNQGFLLDSTRPHTSLCTRDATVTRRWTVLSHPPYGPDFASSTFNLLGSWKKAL